MHIAPHGRTARPHGRSPHAFHGRADRRCPRLRDGLAQVQLRCRGGSEQRWREPGRSGRSRPARLTGPGDARSGWCGHTAAPTRRHNHARIAQWWSASPRLVPRAHSCEPGAGPCLEPWTRSVNRARAGVRCARSGPCTDCGAQRSHPRSSSAVPRLRLPMCRWGSAGVWFCWVPRSPSSRPLARRATARTMQARQPPEAARATSGPALRGRHGSASAWLRADR